MGERGLLEVSPIRPGRSSPSTTAPAPGSVVAPTLEGSRPLLVEVQALVAPTGCAEPAPDGSGRGPEPARAARRGPRQARRRGPRPATTSTPTSPAGYRVDEPALDLPLALALASSLRDRPIVAGTVAIGEVGLLGELRAVGGLDRRLREAARLGFTRGDRAAVERGAPAPPVAGLEIVASRRSREAVAGRARRAGRGHRPPGVTVRAMQPSRRRVLGSAALRPCTIRRRRPIEETVIRTIRILGAALGAHRPRARRSRHGLFTDVAYAGVSSPPGSSRG